MTQTTPNKQELIEIYQLVTAIENKYKYNQFSLYFPDEGEFSRDKYPKQMDLMQRGKLADIRGLLGGNATGKSIWGSYESYLHLSGKYPTWWDGLRFSKPITAWVCARQTKQLRESIQELLFGKSLSDIGTGIIPKEDLLDLDGKSTVKQMEGVAELVGLCKIRHYDRNRTFDGFSTLQFKLYSQGWQEFQGATRDWIWMDEEPDDIKIYNECLARTRGPKGLTGKMLCTFTPLLGFSDIYLGFMPNGQYPENGICPDNFKKHTVLVDWKDVPHLDEDWKKAAIAEWKQSDPNSIDARTSGLAAIGSGKIYPVPETVVVVPPFKIPDYWPRAFGLDFGWHREAVVWGAKDPNTKILYIYSEYLAKEQIPQIKVLNIQAKGKKISGAHDPSCGGRNDSGKLISDIYRGFGLDIIPGDNDSGVRFAILNALETGTLKFFSSCKELLNEYRVYRYDMKNPNSPDRSCKDDLLDSLKYLFSRFDWIAKSEIEMTQKPLKRIKRRRDNVTGY